MENWDLRRYQSARIVGTADPGRLRDAVSAARAHLARQRADTGGTWVSLGPDNVPGRIGALAISQQDGSILYAGSAAGGVFKSTDGGVRWTPLWSDQESLAIGGLNVAPSNHDVVYASTGEWEGGVSSTKYHHFPGVGVYRTTDGGSQWTLSRIPSEWTAAVAVHPTDPDHVYIAGDRSLHRSRDGGRSWDKGTAQTHGILDGTITDVVIDPDDPRRIYVGVHQLGVRRSVDAANTGRPWHYPVSRRPAPCRRSSRSVVAARPGLGSWQP